MKRVLTVLITMGCVLTPTTSQAAAGRCQQYETLLATYAPKGGWSISRMSGYMWRESRCQPEVRSRTRDTGLLQINDINLKYLTQKMGRPITAQALRDPATNVQAAAHLCVFARRAWGNCYAPWRL